MGPGLSLAVPDKRLTASFKACLSLLIGVRSSITGAGQPRPEPQKTLLEKLVRCVCCGLVCWLCCRLPKYRYASSLAKQGAPTGHFQSQRATAVEKALVGSILDVDALLAALEAIPQSLHPSPTPGTVYLL